MAKISIAPPAHTEQMLFVIPRDMFVRRVRRGLLHVILASLAIVWLIPLISALYTAVRTFSEATADGPWSFPPHWLTLKNFIDAWTTGGFSQYFLNTFLVVIPAVILMLLLSSMAAYVLSHHRFKGSRFVFLLFVTGLLLPFQILI